MICLPYDSVIVTLLSLFTRRHLPFGIKSEDMNEETRANIRGKLRSGEEPFSSLLGEPDGYSDILKILIDHLRRDPKLRPTASSLAQQLFEIVLDQAANSPLETEPQIQPTSPAEDLHALATEILAKAKKAKDLEASKSSRTKEPAEKIDRAKFDALVEAAQKPDPSLLFVVGLAHIWDLVSLPDTDELDLGRKPSKGNGFQY